MDFDFAAEGPKILQLLYGLIAFVVVVGGLLLLLDAVPNWFARMREQRAETARTRATAAEAPPPRPATAPWPYANGWTSPRRPSHPRSGPGSTRAGSLSASCCRRCCCSPSGW